MNANFAALRDAIASAVTSLNGKTGAVVLEAGANVTIDDTQAGKVVISAARPETYTFSVLSTDWGGGLHYGDGNVFNACDIPSTAVGGVDLRTFWGNGGTILVYAKPQLSGGYNETKIVPHMFSQTTATGDIGVKIEYTPERNRLLLSQTTNGWDSNNLLADELPPQIDFRVVLIDSVLAP